MSTRLANGSHRATLYRHRLSDPAAHTVAHKPKQCDGRHDSLECGRHGCDGGLVVVVVGLRTENIGASRARKKKRKRRVRVLNNSIL